MEILITEEQYSRYMKRRFHCIRDFVDKLNSGESDFPIPPGDFEWGTYKFILTAYARRSCGEREKFYDEDIHNEIMEFIGDELKQYYDNNK